MKIGILKSDSSRRGHCCSSENGIVLLAVVVFICIFTILGFSLLKLAESEIVLTQKAINKTKAFYLAEAGLEIFTLKLNMGEFENIGETGLGDGTYRVDFYDEEDPPYAIATGNVRGQEKSVRVAVSFLAPPYECAIYAGSLGAGEWTFMLRGQGDPQPEGGGWGWGWSWGNPDEEVGGRDIINGNIFVDGDVALYEESSVGPPSPNPYQLKGDVDATGSVTVSPTASVSGEISEGVAPQNPPDLVGMNYAVNNTHNIAQIFSDEGDDRQHLPSDHELYDVVVKNPSDRSAECDSTAGDDYFLEPSKVTGGAGGSKDATTPLHLGDGRVYYVDGNVWIHNKSTYGFLVDGKVTVVATGDIHISDNIKYADSESLLGLVALGQYDSQGQLTGGGNVYFGDPRYGTMYTVSALMFAADDFLYNTDSVTGGTEEPETGFSIYGNLNALNQISINRDWYDRRVGRGRAEARPAYYDPTQSQWVDAENGTELTSSEIDSLRHYQMKLDYDDRVRTQETQPPRLPRGEGIIPTITNWEEVSSDED